MGPQGALGGPTPTQKGQTCVWQSRSEARALTIRSKTKLLALVTRSRRPLRDGHPRDRQGGLALVLLPYTAMDDDGLPLSSPLLLSQPAVQASHDNPDAPPSSESTGGDVEMESSDSLVFGQPFCSNAAGSRRTCEQRYLVKSQPLRRRSRGAAWHKHQRRGD